MTSLGQGLGDQFGDVTITGDVEIDGALTVPGVLTLVETITIAGSAVTNSDFTTTLDGDNDAEYVIKAHIINPLGSQVTYTPRINGAAWAGTRQHAIFYGTAGSSINTTNNTSVLTLDDTGQVPDEGDLVLYIDHPLSGVSVERLARFESSSADVTANQPDSIYIGRFYYTTPSSGTNITSLGIQSDTASGIGIGSVLKLFRMT